MSDPMESLHLLVARLRAEDTPIAQHVVDPLPDTAFAPPGEHALVIEAVREGYLLHYAEPRLLVGHDADLALLAGDYLYALGIERLAQLGDTRAVHLLADLISTCAQLHAEGKESQAPDVWHKAVEEITRR